MYTHIPIPTDGSEVAGKAVQHGIALAKRMGAEVTMLDSHARLGSPRMRRLPLVVRQRHEFPQHASAYLLCVSRPSPCQP